MLKVKLSSLWYAFALPTDSGLTRDEQYQIPNSLL